MLPRVGVPLILLKLLHSESQTGLWPFSIRSPGWIKLFTGSSKLSLETELRGTTITEQKGIRLL